MAFERALSDIAAHFGLANLLRVQGQNEAARAGYRRVLQLDPSHSEARYFLFALTSGEIPSFMPTSLVKDLFDAYAPISKTNYCSNSAIKDPACLDRLSGRCWNRMHPH